jgi:predicted TIM-barrel fold metal-dependent hydrolase
MTGRSAWCNVVPHQHPTVRLEGHVSERRAIDAVANLFTPEVVASRPEWTRGFHLRKNRLPDDIVAGTPVDQMLEMMDRNGVERAFLIAARLGRRGLPGSWELPPERVAAVVEAHPDRFSGLVGINPYDSLGGLRELERMVRDHGFIGAHLYPHWFERSPDDAFFYPFYTKCAELGIPVQIQVGYSRVYAPEQRVPSVDRPIALDRIACHIPELKLVGIHIGWPWTEEMISVADKHENVFIGTDRYPPSRWPATLVEYLSGVGRDKVIFGTDFPVVPYDVARAELDALGLAPDVEQRLMRENALELYGLPGRTTTV